MPNRIIKESICSSESLEKLTYFQEVFFYRLIVNCDDYGRCDARPQVLKNRLFQLKDKLSLKEVASALAKLAEIGLIKLYEVDGKPYLYMPTWLDHQTPRAKRSKYPAPDDVNASEIICNHMQADEIICNHMQEDAVYIRDTNSIFDIRYSRSDKRKKTPPTREEVKAYFAEKGLSVDADKFYDYYNEGGWKDSKGETVKNWKQKALTWQQHEKPSKRLELNTVPQQKGTADDISRMKKLIEEMQNA